MDILAPDAAVWSVLGILLIWSGLIKILFDELFARRMPEGRGVILRPLYGQGPMLWYLGCAFLGYSLAFLR